MCLFITYLFSLKKSGFTLKTSCGILKRVAPCGTLKRIVWYFEEGRVVFCRGWCSVLKRVAWYFEEGDVVL